MLFVFVHFITCTNGLLSSFLCGRLYVLVQTNRASFPDEQANDVVSSPLIGRPPRFQSLASMPALVISHACSDHPQQPVKESGGLQGNGGGGRQGSVNH